MREDRVVYRLQRSVHTVTQTVSWVPRVFVAIMALLLTTDVCLRALFDMPIMGTVELVELSLVIVVSFSLAYTASEKGHVCISIVFSRLPARSQAVVSSFTYFLGAGIYGLIAWRLSVYALADITRLGGQISTFFGIPYPPFMFVASLGALLLCLEFLMVFLDSLVQAIRK